MGQDPATLLRDARVRAGLNQRNLARLAGTAQSVVARIEGRQTSPSWETLSRLLAAAGFAVDARLDLALPAIETMLDDVPRILALSPDDRLRELRNADRFLSGLRPVTGGTHG